ncbi:E3 ubiquitin-protein ligase CIP8 isoform X2 [Anabas testudineus]|uniref:E3 ubiquitin-protein ligase CIP8 isoform X2 n=1 Tax=Anabas testudineus TaxID=64144 RepID=UPI000E463BA0|nr:E3 ubiquitin-protein ligase CIP8 isoform X2 [Anabas testudineus]
MNSEQEEAEVFSDAEDPTPLRVEEEGEETGDDEDEDAKIFSAWMQQYREGDKQKKTEEEEDEEGASGGGRVESGTSSEVPAPMRTDRRASLPCPLSRLHSSTCAPVTAKVLLRRSSSRRLLPSPQEVTTPALERRPSLIPAIPEALPPERRGQFRRRNVMSLSDADSVCLICHNNLNQGAGGTRELQCRHTFHRECIEEWLWRKQSCPTCHVQVSMPKPVYWSSTRVKVP